VGCCAEKKSVDLIFDINEYGVLSLLLENDLENVPCHSLGYINVGGGWGYRGIVGSHSCYNDGGHYE
jgi:hypothetical protein